MERLKFYKVNQVASILNVCTKTVVSMIREGRLKAVEVGGNERITFRIYEKEIDRFMSESYEKYKSVHHSASEVSK